MQTSPYLPVRHRLAPPVPNLEFETGTTAGTITLATSSQAAGTSINWQLQLIEVPAACKEVASVIVPAVVPVWIPRFGVEYSLCLTGRYGEVYSPASRRKLNRGIVGVVRRIRRESDRKSTCHLHRIRIADRKRNIRLLSRLRILRNCDIETGYVRQLCLQREGSLDRLPCSARIGHLHREVGCAGYGSRSA